MTKWIVVCVNPDGEDAYFGPFDSVEQAEKFMEYADCSNEHFVALLESPLS